MAGRAGDVGAPMSAEGGLSELPPELVGTALGHFADTAPMEVADSLAPVVMATGPVPFDAELDGVSPVEEPLTAFDSVHADPALLGIDSAEPADGSAAAHHDDPSDWDRDGGLDVDERALPGGGPSDGSTGPASDVDGSFGSGADVEAGDLDRTGIDVPDADLLIGDGDAATGSFDEHAAEGFVDGTAALIDDPMVDFDPIDLDDDVGDADPMDDDFDLAD